MSNSAEWDVEILPKESLFKIDFKEIWKYRDLLMMFVKRDFVAAYKQTILGPIWHFIQPILTTLMFLLLFGKIANIPTDGIEAIPFYMSGVTIWNYFSICLTGTSNTFVGNAAIFGKVYFPRLIMPLSVIVSNIVKFLIQFLLLLSVLIYYGITKKTFHIGFSWFLIPVLILMMAGLGLGLGLIISAVTTKYRDFTVLISFGVQLLMYATPIAYPVSYLTGKSKLGYLINYNPLTSVVEGFRYAVFGTSNFQVSSLFYTLIWIVVSLSIGVLVFNRTEKSFMDTV